MTMKRALLPLVVLCGIALPIAFAASTDATTTLSDVHICCGSCVKGVATAIKPVTGVAATADQAKGTIELSAPDKATLQKGVDALTAAGYFGKSSNKDIKVDAATGAKDGKVKTLEIDGVHLCCGSCVTAVKDVLSKVDGVKSDTVKAKATSFTVEGDFEPKAIFDGLQKAGLTGKAKQ